MPVAASETPAATIEQPTDLVPQPSGEASLQNPDSPEVIDAMVTEARRDHVLSSIYALPLMYGLAIDDRATLCPEDVIGAEIDGNGVTLRISTPEIGAIHGVDEQSLLLRGIVDSVRRHGTAVRFVTANNIGRIARRAGYNNGELIPSLTAEVHITPEGARSYDIYRSGVIPQFYPLAPVNNIREDPRFTQALQAARVYISDVPRPDSLPKLRAADAKVNPSDIVTIFAHVGNTTFRALRSEAKLPTIVDIGKECNRSKKRRRREFASLDEVPAGEVPIGKDFIPCKSFTTWFNQAVVSGYLHTGSPPIDHGDAKVVAEWLNRQSKRDRQRTLMMKSTEAA